MEIHVRLSLCSWAVTVVLHLLTVGMLGGNYLPYHEQNPDHLPALRIDTNVAATLGSSIPPHSGDQLQLFLVSYNRALLKINNNSE